MRNRTTIAAIAVIGATATACSSGDSAKPAPTVTVTKTITASQDTQAATDTSNGVLEMGAKRDAVDGTNDLHITVQALEYQQPYKGPQPQKPQDFQGGDTWATVKVKVCTIKGDVEVSQFPWSLAYEDGTNVEVTGSSGGDMPKPEFPMGKKVLPGRCAAGLIAFPVDSKQRPDRLVYEPEFGEPTEWAIPKG
ncbi:DUF4352 domain-containing protein [Streptomyces massasporeus]|uniref:DUF4352 domain-containing protein n=1 Tax=Streptomyces massasporeus TaxID=67324 RepID=UPI003453395F